MNSGLSDMVMYRVNGVSGPARGTRCVCRRCSVLYGWCHPVLPTSTVSSSRFSACFFDVMNVYFLHSVLDLLHGMALNRIIIT
jgi:hypothetical protein